MKDEYFYYEERTFSKSSLKIVVIFIVVLLLVTATFPSFAAGTSSSPLPINTPLQLIRDFFTGPFAWTVSIVSLVVSCGMLAFGGAEFGGTARTFIWLAVILSAIVMANNLMTSWFAGAVIP